MSNENIFAFTETARPPHKDRAHYPGYVSLNDREGRVELTVRSAGGNGMTGSASLVLDDASLAKLSAGIDAYLAKKARPLLVIAHSEVLPAVQGSEDFILPAAGCSLDRMGGDCEACQ